MIGKYTLREAVWMLVDNNPMTYADLARCLGVKEITVRRMTNRNKAMFMKKYETGRSATVQRDRPEK